MEMEQPNKRQKTEPKPTTLRLSNVDGLVLLQTLPSNSVDLILVDPPYIISKDSGMQSLRSKIDNKKSGKTDKMVVNINDIMKKNQEN